MRQAFKDAFASANYRGLQKRVAEELDQDASTVSRWAGGKMLPDEEMWPAIAELLDLPRDHFAQIADSHRRPRRIPSEERATPSNDEEREAVAIFLEGFRAGRRQPR
jgi:hypothetical protein